MKVCCDCGEKFKISPSTPNGGGDFMCKRCWDELPMKEALNEILHSRDTGKYPCK